MVRFELPDDPFGYDTSDPNSQQMATDALTGRHQDAVDAEADRLRTTADQEDPRLKQWISHRYWWARFWVWTGGGGE